MQMITLTRRGGPAAVALSFWKLKVKINPQLLKYTVNLPKHKLLRFVANFELGHHSNGIRLFQVINFNFVALRIGGQWPIFYFEKQIYINYRPQGKVMFSQGLSTIDLIDTGSLLGLVTVRSVRIRSVRMLYCLRLRFRLWSHVYFFKSISFSLFSSAQQLFHSPFWDSNLKIIGPLVMLNSSMATINKKTEYMD